MHKFGIVGIIQHCESTCEHTISTVLSMPDAYARGQQIQMLRDCADICSLTARFIARHSHFAGKLIHLCAEICEMCGRHCLMHPDPISQMCGQTCLQCAQACRQHGGY